MFNIRLKELREEKKLTQQEVADYLSMSRSTYAQYEIGRREPDFGTLSKLADFFGVTGDYLLGRDSILRGSNDIYKIDHFIEVPVIGTISAGLPILAEQNIIGHELTPAKDVQDGDYFYLVVRGDSMIGSRIHDGDKVLVKVTTDITPKDIAVVLVNEQDATLKRVQKLNGHVNLIADNPKYEPIVIDKGEVQIIGKVVKVEFKP